MEEQEIHHPVFGWVTPKLRDEIIAEWRTTHRHRRIHNDEAAAMVINGGSGPARSRFERLLPGESGVATHTRRTAQGGPRGTTWFLLDPHMVDTFPRRHGDAPFRSASDLLVEAAVALDRGLVVRLTAYTGDPAHNGVFAVDLTDPPDYRSTGNERLARSYALAAANPTTLKQSQSIVVQGKICAQQLFDAAMVLDQGYQVMLAAHLNERELQVKTFDPLAASLVRSVATIAIALPPQAQAS